MKTLPQSWPFPTEVKRGEDEDQRAVRRMTRQGSPLNIRDADHSGEQKPSRPPKPRSDAKLDVSTFDALF